MSLGRDMAKRSTGWHREFVDPRGRESMAGGQKTERLAVAGIDRDRLLQKRLRHQIVLLGHAPVMLQRAHHQIPGGHVVRRLAAGAEIFGRIKLRLDRRHQTLSSAH